MSQLSEDYCRCGHVASRHAGGDGECASCKQDRSWTRLTHCSRFAWAERWEPARRSA